MQGMSSYAWGTERTKNERARIWRGELPNVLLACFKAILCFMYGAQRAFATVNLQQTMRVKKDDVVL